MPRAELDAHAQAAMVRRLREALDATLIETHISWVLVCGGTAYKFKKALKTAFLDQTTLALRQRACDEELRLNRRTAPALYEAVVPITGDPDAPHLGGPGPVLDHAVRMRSFAQSELWENRAAQGTLAAADIDAFVPRLVAFHAAAAIAEPDSELGQPALMRDTVLKNLGELAQAGGEAIGGAGSLARLRAWECRAYPPFEARQRERRARGRVRECHGDLHLGNVTRFDGQPMAFDGIEFAPALRWLDVLGDIAFLAMDLQAHGLPHLAHRFVNAYVEAAAEHDGLPVLDYQLVHRALVRAKIALLRSAQEGADIRALLGDAHRYLALALQLTEPPPPRLWVTHGCSASGKSTHAQARLEASAALRLRSDIERRRIEPEAGQQRYGEAMNARTYARLADQARRILTDGHPVIVDATFLRRADRDRLRQVARDLDVPFGILDFATGADAALLRQRLRARSARGGDASEADEAVLEAQLRAIEPLQADELAVAQRCFQTEPRPGLTPG